MILRFFSSRTGVTSSHIRCYCGCTIPTSIPTRKRPGNGRIESFRRFKFGCVSALKTFFDIRLTVLLSSWHALLNVSSDQSEKQWARDLLSTMAQNVKHFPVAPNLANGITSKDRIKATKTRPENMILKLSEHYLALQMTVVDFELYSKVKINELLQINWEFNYKSNLVPIREHLNRTALLVATQILTCKDSAKRASALSKCIRTADVLLHIGNMFGVIKIYKGLTMPAVVRLHKLWKTLSDVDKAIWANLENILLPTSGKDMESSRSCSVYNHIQRTAGTLFIPCFPLLMLQLENVEKNMPDYLENGCVNFDKMKSLAEFLFDFKKFQQIPYNIEKDKNVMDFWTDTEPLTVEQLNHLSENWEPENPSTEEFLLQPWWFDAIDRADAENLLSACNYDAFLVRTSSKNPGCFALSHRNYETRVTLHTLIEARSGGFLLQGSNIIYPTLYALVEHCPDLYGFRAAASEMSTGENAKKKRSSRNHLFTFRHHNSNHSDESRFDHEHRLRLADAFHAVPSTSSERFFSAFPYSSLAEPTTIFNNAQVNDADKALQDCNFSALLKLLHEGLPLNCVFRNQQTLFHVAGEFNDPRLVEYLVRNQYKCPDINARDSYGWTALHSACYKGPSRHNVISLLMNYGATVNVLNQSGCTPLHYFVRGIPQNNKEAHEVERLINLFVSRGSCLNSEDVNHDTPLHQACLIGNMCAVKALCANGAALDVKNKTHETPLAIAVRMGYSEIATFLQQQKREEAKSKDGLAYSDLLLNQKGRIVVDSGQRSVDYKQELGQLKLEFETSPLYKEFFAAKGHWNIVGNTNEFGNFIISVIGESPSLMLIRTNKVEQSLSLTKMCSSTGLIKSLKILTGNEHKCYDGRHVWETVESAEGKLRTSSLQFGLLYVPDGRFSDDVFDSADFSKNFEDFTDFLGDKIKQGSDYLVSTSVNKVLELNFQMITNPEREQVKQAEIRRTKLCSSGVVLAFVEAPTFDPTPLFNSGARVVVAVKPIGNHYKIAVCRSNVLKQFTPLLPYPSVIARDEYLRRFLLTKLINAHRLASAPSVVTKTEKDREAALRVVFNFCKNLPTLQQLENPSGMAKEGVTTSQTKDIDLGRSHDKQLAPLNLDVAREKLSKYKIGKELGKGATGVAFVAQQRVDGIIYCMKVINKAILKDPKFKKQIEGEVKVLAKLDHPHIVKLIEEIETEETHNLVLELCEGGSLDQDVKNYASTTKSVGYPEQRAAQVMYQLMSAVAYMHAKGVSHRDLKPQNIMFSDKKRDKIKVVDFGFSKDLVSQPMENTCLGTLDYLAPEMITRQEYDYYKIDIYSSGVIAYYLLYGRTPFGLFKSPKEFYDAVLNGKIPFDSSRTISDEAKAFLLSMMNLDPEKRPQAYESLKHPWLKSANVFKNAQTFPAQPTQPLPQPSRLQRSNGAAPPSSVAAANTGENGTRKPLPPPKPHLAGAPSVLPTRVPSGHQHKKSF
eukprot:TRINITY_DN3050_c0_g1_i1.p1 TRINITY_DN3050_c0_g1~~TRINITY_DN3050_c0_g1_i1.p1  ORF type:complete len:1468 (+),score=377.33 TRINITY_DN3050_c0_g1_i1:545-4948(+)